MKTRKLEFLESVVIRELIPEDVKWVVSCQQDLYSSNFPRAKITKRFLHSQEEWIQEHFNLGQRSAFFIAHRGRENIGFIWGKVFDNLLEGFEGMVLQNYVSRPWRSKGVGRKLVIKLEEFFKKHAVNKISLNVTLDNDSALFLYKSCGFMPVRYEMEKRFDMQQDKEKGID
ncbi:MAG: GNAT family N-acetyltransferase [Deltaproteobacteria bacterium]|nr:GNAT family N-acetyltransferase [Deltaproteobacteria bacterium]